MEITCINVHIGYRERSKYLLMVCSEYMKFTSSFAIITLRCQLLNDLAGT